LNPSSQIPYADNNKRRPAGQALAESKWTKGNGMKPEVCEWHTKASKCEQGMILAKAGERLKIGKRSPEIQ